MSLSGRPIIPTNQETTMQHRTDHQEQHGRTSRHVRIATLALGIATIMASATALAEPVEFADDFSADSLRYTVDRRPDDRSARTYDVLEDRVTMTVSAVSDEDQGQSDMGVWGQSDSLTARVSLDSVDLPVDRFARGMVRISGQFWNDTADGGFDGGTGDVYVQLRLQAESDGSRDARICVDRQTTADGFNDEGVNLFENGNCESFPDFVPELGTEYTLSIAVDRAAGVLTYSVDDRARSVPLGQPVFIPASHTRNVQVQHEGTPGQAVGSVHAIATDTYSQDFTTEAPIIGPYRPFFDLEGDGRSLGVVDGRARLEVSSTEGGNESLTMQVTGESDRIEATLELSSESTSVAGTGEPDEERLHMSLGGGPPPLL